LWQFLSRMYRDLEPRDAPAGGVDRISATPGLIAAEARELQPDGEAVITRLGLEYRQEYYAGEAEDRAKVLSVDEQTEVPFGHFTGVLLTKDLVPLEPRVSEYKLYGRGSASCSP
jgi:hypothetical protein